LAFDLVIELLVLAKVVGALVVVGRHCEYPVLWTIHDEPAQQVVELVHPLPPHRSYRLAQLAKN
jgi:hypothetical protein